MTETFVGVGKGRASVLARRLQEGGKGRKEGDLIKTLQGQEQGGKPNTDIRKKQMKIKELAHQKSLIMKKRTAKDGKSRGGGRSAFWGKGGGDLT